MADVQITGKPKKVSYLTAPIADGGFKFTAKWSNPWENTVQTSSRRADAITIWWSAWYTTDGKNVKDYTPKYYEGGSASSSSIDFEDHLGYVFFYPRGAAKLLKVSIGVNVSNVKGFSGDVVTTRTLYDPAAPTVGVAEFEDGTLTVPVECEERNERQPLYDVEWKNERTSNVPGYEALYRTTGATGDGSGDISFDVTSDLSVWGHVTRNPSWFFKFVTSARARGAHGASGWVSRTTFVSLPIRPVISRVDVSETGSTDRVCVVFASSHSMAYHAKTAADRNHYNQHPATGCRLQVLKNVTETDAQAAYSMEGWTDCDVEDNGTCSVLYVPASEVRPDPDKITWVRVKMWNMVEDALWMASVPYRLRALETESPTAEDDVVVLAPLRAGSDGTSIEATLYWDKNGTDDSTGTQVDWSTDPEAWSSTVEPSTYSTLRDDGAATYGGVRYNSHTTLFIRGLDAGETYYVKARRYLDGDSGTTYGRWSAKRSCAVGKAPEAVTLSAPERISYGQPLPVSWAASGSDEDSAPSLSWRVDAVLGYGGVGDVTSSMPRFELVSGTGGTRATAPWSKVSGAWTKAFRERYGRAPTTNDHSAEVELWLVVTVSVKGGASVASAPVSTLVKRTPGISVSTGMAVMDAQPITVSVRSTEKLASVDVVVRSQGVASDLPDGGRLMQEEGHVMWSGRIPLGDLDPMDEDPAPYAEGYVATLPRIEGLVDNACYEVSVRGTALVDGTMSGTTTRLVRVELAHKACAPGDFSIAPADYVDEAGNRRREAVVTLTDAPDYPDGDDGAGDAFDLYRVTPDGATRVASGLSVGDSVTDPYAPFGELGGSYRLCTVTPDGAMNWRDEGYALGGRDMRIDFGSEYVELPYNVDTSDSFEKDFEARHHYGGGRPEGYWNEGVGRRSSLSTDLIRVTDAEVARRVRMLAQHVGPCFVRLPNGCAFEADVQVTDLSEGHASSAIAVALDVTEVSPSGAYEVEAP